MQEWHQTDEMYGMCNGVGLTQYEPLLLPDAGILTLCDYNQIPPLLHI